MDQRKELHINTERSIQEINTVGSSTSHNRDCFFEECPFRGCCQIETDKEENRSKQNDKEQSELLHLSLALS